jgi:antitoxin FitA
MIGISPHGAGTVRGAFGAKMLAIPLVQGCGVFRLEEQSAQSDNAFHAALHMSAEPSAKFLQREDIKRSSSCPVFARNSAASSLAAQVERDKPAAFNGPLRWWYHDIAKQVQETFMAQFVVRNIEDGVKLRLQRRATRNGRSMEEEVREILRSAINEENVPSGGVGTEIASLFSKVGIVSDIPELRGHGIEPVEFEENVMRARRDREQSPWPRRLRSKNKDLDW